MSTKNLSIDQKQGSTEQFLAIHLESNELVTRKGRPIFATRAEWEELTSFTIQLVSMRIKPYGALHLLAVTSPADAPMVNLDGTP